MNAPKDKLEDIIAVLPGMKSPTVMPLAQDGWCSVHTVLDEKRFWEIIGKLKALGAFISTYFLSSAVFTASMRKSNSSNISFFSLLIFLLPIEKMII